MSEFLAEAQVLITPDLTRFRAELEAGLSAAVRQVGTVTVPVAASILGGAAAAARATSGLVAEQQAATATTLGLANAASVETSAFGRQATVLHGTTAATLELAGAQTTLDRSSAGSAARIGQVEKAAFASTAGMLGLRGAVLTAGTAFLAATVGFQAFGKAVQSTIDFTRELAVFRVTAGATADEMNRVADAARELGRDITLPGVSAGDAAAALTELSKAGLSVQQSIDAARGTLQLATAAEIDNAAAAQLVANSLNAFHLAGEDASRVADLLAGAANASQGSITDMGLALRQASAAADLVGLNVNQTVTLLTELARAGLSASDAGTSLRTTLLRLVGDFPKVAAEVDRLGLRLRDVNGSIRPEFFSELGQRLQKMTPAARQATIALLGGSDALRAIGILSRSTTADFQALEEQISRTGIAQEVASAQTEGLGGDVEAAKNQFADLGLTVGNVASGPLSLLVRTAGAAAGSINDLNRSVEESSGGGGFFKAFGDVIDGLQDSFSDLNISFQEGVRGAQAASERFSIFDRIAANLKGTLDGVAESLRKTAAELARGQNLPQDQGLGVQQILNRVTGFDTAETAARIRGDTNALLSVLESERQFLIDQLDRQFVKNRPALFRRLQDALLGVTNDIDAIGKQSAAATKKTAADLASATREADSALLQTLSNRREDAQRKASAATETQGLQDDIAAQNRIQALIQDQIKKIRDRIKDEQTRKQAIRELRIALIASRAEEERLREEQRQRARDTANEILDLRIQIAETKGQERLEAQLLRQKIARLKKQIAAAKGEKLLQTQLRLELAQTQKQLEDLLKQQEDTNKTGKSVAQQQFEFLQAQQGFAANLLGNLIPGFATAGLVGNAAPTTQAGEVRAQTQTSAEVSQAARGGVRPVQVDTTNALLRQILAALQGRHTQPPEAAFNRRAGSASFDTL